MMNDGPRFKNSRQNFIAELSELRLAITQADEVFDLACLLRFGATDVDLHGSCYSVGITEARLQLSLEGCETCMGSDYGVAGLASAIEEQTSKTQMTFEGRGGGSIGADGTALPSVSIGAGGVAVNTRTVSATKDLLPVTALPNNMWRIRSADAALGKGSVLEGSAMDGDRLCRIQRKDGGNRLGVSAELQVRRNAISVKPAKGSSLGKRFSLRRNQDAIVAKVLEKAIRREAAAGSDRTRDGTIVASIAEVSEE